MGVSIGAQIFYLSYPIYSLGCVIALTLLNSLVINEVREEEHIKLLETQKIERQHKEELGEAIHLAYTDPLTNIKNKHAYVEEEDRIDKLIGKNEMTEFAVAVFDLNGLKHINDTLGHDAGDQYIIEATKIICKHFGEKNIYRFGGDEFVAILEGEDYENRYKSIDSFEKEIEDNLNKNKPVISSGASRYKKGEDNTYHAVFNRADKIMYARKDFLKEQTNK